MVSKISLLSLANLLGAFSSFIYIPFIIKSFGLNIYGQFVTIQTIVAIAFAISNTNSWQGLIHFSSKKGIDGTTYRNILCIDFFLSLITSLCFCFIFYSLHYLFKATVQTTNSFIYLFATIPFLACNTQIATIRIHSKYFEQAIVEIIYILTKLSLIIYSCSINNLRMIALSFLLAEVSRFSLLFLVSYKLTTKKTSESDPDMKSIFSYSFWGWLSGVTQLPASQLDKILISVFIDPSVSGIYNVIKRVGMSITFVTNPISQILYPKMRLLVVEDLSFELYKLYKKSTIYLAGFLFFWFTCIYVTSNLWIKILISNESAMYIRNNFNSLLPMLLIAYFLILCFVPLHSVFLSVGLTKNNTIITIVANTVNFLLSFSLINLLGIYSIVIGFMCSDFIIISYKIYWVKYKIKFIN